MTDDIAILRDLILKKSGEVDFLNLAPATSLLPSAPAFVFGTFPETLGSFYFRHTDLWAIGVFKARGFDVLGAFILLKESRLYCCPEANIHQPYVQAVLQGLGALKAPKQRLCVPGQAVLLAGPGYSVYGHWLVDFLPKLYLLHAAGYDLRNLKFLLPADAPAFGLDWLLLLGIPPENMTRFDPGADIVRVEELLIPTTLHNGARATPLLRESIAFLLGLIDSRHVPNPDAKASTSVFISRNKAPQTRVLRNRERIEELATRVGLPMVHPQTLPLLNQVRLFQNASILVGEYGSGLHGSMFSPPGTIVCALRGTADHPAFVQSAFGQILQHPTGYMFGTMSPDNQNGEFEIAEETFDECLRFLLRQVPSKDTVKKLNLKGRATPQTYTKRVGQERIHLGIHYLEFFRLLNQHCGLNSYFEIGTCEGDSLSAFSCDSVCVDTTFSILKNAINSRNRSLFFQMTSDEFFRSNRLRTYFPEGPDISFLDGLHRFEFLLRDFLNTEAECRPNSIIFLHDCLPLNERMTEREMRLDLTEDESTRYAWTGDVWRILPTLKKFRSDLQILFFDCGPTGLVGVTRLDPGSEVLRQRYDEIVDEMMSLTLSGVGLDQLWNTYPTIDTARLCAHPADLMAVLNLS